MISKREQILQTSTRLFRHKGYAATSMQDIAKDMGIKAASLYNHISSKQEILNELLNVGAELFLNGMNEVRSSSLAPMEKIEKLISLHVQLSIRHTDLMALMAVEWRHLDDASRSKHNGMRENYEADFRLILKEAREAGAIQSIDLDIALFSILTTLQRFYAWYDRHSDLNSLDIEKYLVQCLLGGIRV